MISNVRIVPVKDSPLTQGTKVFVGEKEIKAVQKIELVAHPRGAWRAIITVIPENIEEILAEAVLQHVDVTTMQSDSVEWPSSLGPKV